MTERDAIMDVPPDEWHKLLVSGALAFRRYQDWKKARNRVLELERDGSAGLVTEEGRRKMTSALTRVRSLRELYDESRELLEDAVAAAMGAL